VSGSSSSMRKGSWSKGILMAPGMWPASNSYGSRTSRMLASSGTWSTVRVSKSFMGPMVNQKNAWLPVKATRFDPLAYTVESMTEHHAFGSLSARQLRDAIAAGTYTARQVTEYYLSVIHQRTDLGAFMAVHDDAALARADELDEAYAATGVVGPLHGLPLALKDTVNVAGMVTTFGSRLFADTEPQTEDDPVSLNMNTAGVVQVG